MPAAVESRLPEIAMNSFEKQLVTGKWRSSRGLIVGTACLALFTECLLGGFPVPMLPYMLEERLHNDPSDTMDSTNRLLSLHGFVTMICSPLFAKVFDKTSSNKGPLFLSLGLCLLGTALVALTPTVSALYLGRFLQAVAGSAAWLVCTGMITETAGPGEMGTVMGLSTSIIMIGTVSGPMLGGVLLGWFGYWAAWSVPIALLLLDFVARLLVKQPESRPPKKAKDSGPGIAVPGHPPLDVEGAPTETSRLLPPPTSTREVSSDPAKKAEGRLKSKGNFYGVMLRDVGIWASILNQIAQAGIRAGFNTTLPVYLRDTFNWGPSSAGATFFALQLPVVFMSPLMGWVRDRVGVRNPTTIGWVFLCPFLCCLGIPGSGMPWLSASKKVEEAMFMVCVCGIGLFLPFVQGAGALHMRNAVGKREAEIPGVFGRNGGRARCFAMISVSFNAGLALGPAVVGGLFDSVGYFYTNVVLGAACLGVALITFLFIDV